MCCEYFAKIVLVPCIAETNLHMLLLLLYLALTLFDSFSCGCCHTHCRQDAISKKKNS